MTAAEHLTAKAEFKRLGQTRQPFLDQAYISSALTIPALFPEKDDNGQPPSRIGTTFQAVGARGVNNLSSKLLIALFPTRPFFRLVADVARLQGASEQARDDIEASLLKLEDLIMAEMELLGLRVPLFEALKHLVVTGNVLMHLPNNEKQGGMRIFHLDAYVVDRDPEGNLLQIIVRERISPLALPPSAYESVNGQVRIAGTDGQETPEFVEMYTWIKWDPEEEKFNVHQELGQGQIIENTEGVYTRDNLPWNPLRMTTISGNDYGRGLVEDYEGDLRSLEGLAIGILEGTAAAVRVLWFVNPNGFTNIADLEKPNGAIIPGFADDVGSLTTDKQADLQVAANVAQSLETRLSRAFLLNSAITRNAERVTAQEVRYQAEELEATLGGVYSALTQDLQVPLILGIMERLLKRGSMPKLKKGVIRPSIVTGIEALNRGHDLQNLQIGADAFQAAYGPGVLERYTDARVGIQRFFTAAGVDLDGWLKDEEQIQQELVEAQQAEMINKIAPNVANAVANAQPQQGS